MDIPRTSKRWLRQESTVELKKFTERDYDIDREIRRRERRNKKRPRV